VLLFDLVWRRRLFELGCFQLWQGVFDAQGDDLGDASTIHFRDAGNTIVKGFLKAGTGWSLTHGPMEAHISFTCKKAVDRLASVI